MRDEVVIHGGTQTRVAQKRAVYTSTRTAANGGRRSRQGQLRIVAFDV
jgi:hypothetical protein